MPRYDITTTTKTRHTIKLTGADIRSALWDAYPECKEGFDIETGDGGLVFDESRFTLSWTEETFDQKQVPHDGIPRTTHEDTCLGCDQPMSVCTCDMPRKCECSMHPCICNVEAKPLRLNDRCTHPSRQPSGRHEVYTQNGGRLMCRACGATDLPTPTPPPSIPVASGHVWHDCKKHGHVRPAGEDSQCVSCEGGLGGCVTCGQWEADIEPTCPGPKKPWARAR